MNSPILKEWMGPAVAQARPLFRFFLGSSTAHTTIQELIALASCLPVPGVRGLLLDLLIWLESYAYKAQIARTMREVDEQAEVIGGLVFTDTWNDQLKHRINELREENPQARLTVLRVPLSSGHSAQRHQPPEIGYAAETWHKQDAERRLGYTSGLKGALPHEVLTSKEFLDFLVDNNGLPAILVESPSDGSAAQAALGGEIRITAPFTYLSPNHSLLRAEPSAAGEGYLSTNDVPNLLLNGLQDLLSSDDDDGDDKLKVAPLGDPIQRLKDLCETLDTICD